MKRTEKRALVLLLAAAFIAAVSALVATPAKCLASAGLLLDIAAIVQLDISGLFDRIAQEFSDEEKYPYGPPSYITREIIDDPEAPVRMAIRNTLYSNQRTGFWLLVAGFALQFLSIWV